MRPILLLLLAAFVLNACKKGEKDLFQLPTGTCLLLKKTQVNVRTNGLSSTEEFVYTYNSKGLKTSEKYTGKNADGVFTNTRSFEYNSDGQLIKSTSGQFVTTFKYENKLLTEERTELGNELSLTQYSYNSNGQKTKVLSKTTKDNKASSHAEYTYEYQDTLLVKSKTQNFMFLDKQHDTESVYKYTQAHQLEERKDFNANSELLRTEKHEYDPNGKKIKTITSDYIGTIQEYIYTYNNNKLIEENGYYTGPNNARQHAYKMIYEYKEGNVVKTSTFYGDKLVRYEEFDYTCGK